MSNKQKVLNIYKKLLKTSAKTFKNDLIKFKLFKTSVKNEFIKNKFEDKEFKIEKLILLAESCNELLSKNVVQAVEQSENPGTWTLNITKDTELGDNKRI